MGKRESGDWFSQNSTWKGKPPVGGGSSLPSLQAVTPPPTVGGGTPAGGGEAKATGNSGKNLSGDWFSQNSTWSGGALPQPTVKTVESFHTENGKRVPGSGKAADRTPSTTEGGPPPPQSRGGKDADPSKVNISKNYLSDYEKRNQGQLFSERSDNAESEKARLLSELEYQQGQLEKYQNQYALNKNVYKDGYYQGAVPKERARQTQEVIDHIINQYNSIEKAQSEQRDIKNVPERKKLNDELSTMEQNKGYITDGDEAMKYENRRNEIISQLHSMDEESGRNARAYDDRERLTKILAGTAKQSGGAYLNAMGTPFGLAGEGDEQTRAINDSAYSGYATDELSTANMREAIKENPNADVNKSIGILDTNKKIFDKATQTADKLIDSGNADLMQAKEGLGKVGQAAVDIASNVINMGFDAVGNAVGLGMTTMFVRCMGQGAQEARKAGASVGQQLMYGMATGGIEVATEKIFDGVAGIFGKGAADDLVDSLVRKLTNSNTGRMFLLGLINMSGEGVEEVMSDLLNPFAKRIYDDNALRELWENGYDKSELLYDFIIGTAIGALGQVGAVGQNAGRVFEMEGKDWGEAYDDTVSGLEDINALVQEEKQRLVAQAGAQEQKVAIDDSAHEELSKTEEKANSKELIEKLKSNIPSMENDPAVSKLTGNEFPKGDKKITEQVGDFFRSLGNKIFRKGFGDVELTERGVKSDIMHGLGRAKAVTFAAVPDVIANGKQIDYQPNWKGRGYDSYVFAAPIEINGVRSYVAAVVLKDVNNRFYLHEVVDENGELIYKIENTPATGTEASSEPTLTLKAGNSEPVYANPDVGTGENNVSTDNNIPQGGGAVNSEGEGSRPIIRDGYADTDPMYPYKGGNAIYSEDDAVIQREIDKLEAKKKEAKTRGDYSYIVDTIKKLKANLSYAAANKLNELFSKLDDETKQLVADFDPFEFSRLASEAARAREAGDKVKEAQLEEKIDRWQGKYDTIIQKVFAPNEMDKGAQFVSPAQEYMDALEEFINPSPLHKLYKYMYDYVEDEDYVPDENWEPIKVTNSDNWDKAHPELSENNPYVNASFGEMAVKLAILRYWKQEAGYQWENLGVGAIPIDHEIKLILEAAYNKAKQGQEPTGRFSEKPKPAENNTEQSTAVEDNPYTETSEYGLIAAERNASEEYDDACFGGDEDEIAAAENKLRQIYAAANAKGLGWEWEFDFEQNPAENNTAPLQQNIDNNAGNTYNSNQEMQGDNANVNTTGVIGQVPAKAGTDGNGETGEGLQRPVNNKTGKPHEVSEDDGRGDLRHSGIVLLSEEARNAIESGKNKDGSSVVAVDVEDVSGDKATFCSALDEAKAADKKNGWAVSPKTVEELEESGAKVLMSADGSVGVAVTADGDIEAVFANHSKGAPKGATNSLIPLAIANGGTKLDCYGESLVYIYSRYGFVPVARIDFNPEYANEGWTPEKGTPSIYVMVHNGDSADTVVANRDNYKLWTKEELDNLPHFGKDGYDDAMAYRDMVLEKQKGGKAAENSENNSGAPPTGGAVNSEGEQSSPLPSSQATPPPPAAGGGNTDTVPSNGAERERGFTANVRTDQSIDEAIKQELESDPEYYKQKKNKDVLEGAKEIWAKGFDHAKSYVEQCLGQAKAGMKLPLDIVPLSKMVINELSKQGNITEARRIAADVAAELTYYGQAGQAARILRDADPMARVMAVERAVEKLNADLTEGQKRQMGKDAETGEQILLKIPEELKERLAQAAFDQEKAEQFDDVLKEIQQDIAEQLPSSAMQKWTAVRYLNMLGNFKTQGRNLIGNTLMGVANKAKRSLQAIGENFYQSFNKDYEKTTSLFVPRGLRKEAAADFENVKDLAAGEGKYADGTKGFAAGVRDRQTIFSSKNSAVNTLLKPFEGYRKATNWAMEAGDAIFLKMQYADALGGWLNAHGIKSLADATPEQLAKGRAWAIKEAQEATFRDSNQVSDFVASLGRFKKSDVKGEMKNTATQKAVSGLVEGIIPFKRTPANVAVRAVEYSPLGFINTFMKTVEATVSGQQAAGSGQRAVGSGQRGGYEQKVYSDDDVYTSKPDNQAVAEAINSAAKSFTGTALCVAGYILAKAGVLRGKGDDEDDKLDEFEKMQGEQDYGLTVGNVHISLSQFAPTTVPLFMGARFYELMDGGGITSLDDVNKIVSCITNPLLEMSMLSSLNDALDNLSKFNGSENSLMEFLGNTMVSYMTQVMTNTLGGQIKQATQEYRKTSYTTDTGLGKYLGKNGQYKVSQTASKIPFLPDYNKQDYVDAWGRKQKSAESGLGRAANALINPTYYSKDRKTEVDDELERLYRDNKGKDKFPNVLPQRPSRDKKYTVSGKSRVLSPEQFEKFSIDKGQKSLELVTDYMKSSGYKSATDAQRAEVISKLYDLATSQAIKGIYPAYTDSNDYVTKLAHPEEYYAAVEAAKAGNEKFGTTGLNNFQALVNAGKMSKKDEDKLSKHYLSESQQEVYSWLTKYESKAKDTVAEMKALNPNGDSHYSQTEVWEYLKGRDDLTGEEKAELWEMTTTGKATYWNYKP